MEIQIKKLEDVEVTGSLRMVSQSGNPASVGLYMAKTQEVARTEAPFYKFETTLTALPFNGADPLSPKEIAMPQPLPVSPGWDVVLTESGEGSVCYSFFGGGWNTLKVDTITGGQVTTGYSYEVEASDKPAFMLNTSTTAAKQNYVSAVLSSCQLGLIGLQDQKGQLVPGVSDLVGSSENPVSSGSVLGNLSAGLPQKVSLVFKRDKNIGPLSPGGLFCGSLFFNTYDTTTYKLGTEVPVLSDIAFSEFDVAAAGDYFCLFAVTGDGAPLLGLYDQTGKALGSPNMPAGSWNNAGHWVANPTIVATPPGKEIGFSFAFIEMEGDAPSCIYTGTLSSPAITS